MRASDWITVLAILLAPLVAIQVSIWLEDRKRRRQRQGKIFETLMSTRASALDPKHVEALNTIDVAFYGSGKNARAVIDAWKVYLDHLNTPAVDDPRWGDRRVDLLVELLQKMAYHLDYHLDKSDIKRTAYFPQGYGDADWDHQQIRRSLLSLLKGERALLISPQPAPPSASHDFPMRP